MNSPINTTGTILPNTVRIGDAAELPQDAGAGASVDAGNPDWFSASTLANGQTIEAARFDSTPNRLSVEQAVDSILARVVPGGSDDNPWR